MCQNVKCNNDDSFVRQFININCKISMENIIPAQHENPNDEPESENSKEESKSKVWIITIIFAFLLVVSLCVYLLIDYKKKLWIFKTKVIEKEKKYNNEKVKIEDNVETISIQSKRRNIKNQSNYFSIDMKTISNM